MRVSISLSILVKLRSPPPRVKRYVMEPNVFMEYLEKGIACSLNIFGHEEYPSNNLDQNNSTHGVYSVTH